MGVGVASVYCMLAHVEIRCTMTPAALSANYLMSQ